MNRLVLIFVFLFLNTVIFSQGEKCATETKYASEILLHPEKAAWTVQQDKAYREWLRNRTASTRAVVTIPVVVHVIQQDNQEVINEDRIKAQIDVLNEDFRKMAGTNGDGSGVDTEIQFCLASIDPDGCPTSGINRIVHTGLALHDDDTEEIDLKGLIQWDPYQYLNIWVPARITTQTLGYATFPDWLAGNPKRDGVVVSGTYFGKGFGTPPSNYNKGRTLTHEVGHWLGLWHTFQDGCNGNDSTNCTFRGDRVCDTPQTSDANYGCPNPQNTCTESPIDFFDQTENYMDYVNDDCMNMYTQGQKDRMQYYLANVRNQLVSASNLAATGCDGTIAPGCSPTADFIADANASCVDLQINFSDLSKGQPTDWNWSFPGGTPSSSTQKNPQITYTAPGLYAVTLEVTNALGSNKITRNSFIEVRASEEPPLQEGFENILFLPVGWQVADQDGQGTWERTNQASTEGSFSFLMRNYDINGFGTYDDLSSLSIDLSRADSANLSFDYAYKRFNAFRLDTLKIMVSKDCGINYDELWAKTGTDLATVTGFGISQAFTPSGPQDWATIQLDLSNYLGEENVKVKFRSIGWNGQNIFVDRVNVFARIDSSLTPINPVLEWKVTAYPVPTEDDINLLYELPEASMVSIELYDRIGRAVFSETFDQTARGKFSWTSPVEIRNRLEPGIYYARVTSDFGTEVRTLILY